MTLLLPTLTPSTPLSLVVALLAVLTALASVTDKAFKDSTVRLELVGTSKFVQDNKSDFVQLDLSVKNIGKVNAMIEPLMECSTALSPVLLNARGNYRIEAGKTADIAFISPAIRKDRVAAFSCVAHYLNSAGNRVNRIELLFFPGQPVKFAQ